MCGHFTWSIIRLWTFYVKLHVWLLQDWLLNFDKNIGALCSFCLKIFWTKSKVYTILSTIFGDHISERRANENLTPNKVLKNEIVYTCQIWCEDDISLWSNIHKLFSTWQTGFHWLNNTSAHFIRKMCMDLGEKWKKTWIFTLI